MKRSHNRRGFSGTLSDKDGPGCGGKRQYDTFTEAQRVAAGFRRHNDGPMQPYHCTTCNRFHIGTAKPRRHRPRHDLL